MMEKSFFNKDFKKLADLYTINHNSTYSVLKASIVKRTLKNKMFREFFYSGTYYWIDIYRQLIDEYNRTNHGVINLRPIDVTKSSEQILQHSVYHQIKTFPKPKYRAGDYVRTS